MFVYTLAKIRCTLNLYIYNIFKRILLIWWLKIFLWHFYLKKGGILFKALLKPHYSQGNPLSRSHTILEEIFSAKGYEWYFSAK